VVSTVSAIKKPSLRVKEIAKKIKQKVKDKQ
jgi:hypothetical protein